MRRHEQEPPDLELEARESSWMRSRIYVDSRRLLNIRTRARAMLAATTSFVTRARASETRDPEVRKAFFDMIYQVDRIARGLPIYEFVHGVGYVGRHRRPAEALRLIGEAARMANLEDAALDEATWKMAVLEDAALDEGERFVSNLRATTPRRSPSGRARFLVPVAPTETSPASPPLSYDDTTLRNIVAQMPDQLSWREAAALGETLLGDLGGDADADAGVKPARAGSDAMLVAMLRLVTAAEARLEVAAAEKARRLTVEYPRHNGTEDDYLRRAADLDAELVQDARELLGSLRAALVSCAVKMSSIKHWPGNRTSPKHVRARALASAVARSRPFSSEELDMATASLGHGIGAVT
jgi:hypothetical protein